MIHFYPLFALDPATIAALMPWMIGISAAGTAGSIGTSLYEGAANRDAQAAAAKAAEDARLQQVQAAKDQQSKMSTAGMSQMAPGLQSQTGGNLTPDALSGLAGSISGSSNPNDSYSAILSYLGIPTQGSPAGSGSAGGAGGSPTIPSTPSPVSGANKMDMSMFPNAAVPAMDELSGRSV